MSRESYPQEKNGIRINRWTGVSDAPFESFQTPDLSVSRSRFCLCVVQCKIETSCNIEQRARSESGHQETVNNLGRGLT
jgi:hypothetical protein